MQYTLLSSYIQLILEINLKHCTDKSKKLYGISHNWKQNNVSGFATIMIEILYDIECEHPRLILI